MSNSMRVVLAGIVFLLSSLFCMGICILKARTGGPETLTFALFVIGVGVSIIGLFFVRDEAEGS